MAKKSRKERKQQTANQQPMSQQPNAEFDADEEEEIESTNEAIAANQPPAGVGGFASTVQTLDDENDEDVEDYPYPDEDDEEVLARATAAVKGNPSKRRKRSATKSSPIVSQQKNGATDHEKIMKRLANPTIFVTEEQMRAEYGYVLRDIRNMFLLAAVLIVALILMALVF